MCYVPIIIRDRFDNYSLEEVPSTSTLKILTETLCSAVELLVELTVAVGGALLGALQVCRDIPRIIPGQV